MVESGVRSQERGRVYQRSRYVPTTAAAGKIIRMGLLAMLRLRSSVRLVGVATALFIASSLGTAKATEVGEAADPVGSGTGDSDDGPTPDDSPQYECKDMEEQCSAWSKLIVEDGQTMCEHNRLDRFQSLIPSGSRHAGSLNPLTS